jgi:DNA repair protein RecO (recombination protein O)
MPRPRVSTTPAIVLRQRKLGDADKIVTLFTANRGKLEAVAKGVRRSRSKLAGHVEPLAHTTFQLAQGKNLDIVTQAESIESFAALRDDLDRMSRALYVCEILDRSTEIGEPHFDLYRLLLDTLRRIAQLADTDTPVRYFEMQTLDVLGYRPELDECVTCRERLKALTNYWTARGGGIVCPSCSRDGEQVRPLSVNAVKLLRLLLHARWAHVEPVVVEPDLALELERAMLDYMRWVLDRDVRSAAFIDAVRRPRLRSSRQGVGASHPR